MLEFKRIPKFINLIIISGNKAKNNLASVSSALNNNSASPADSIPEISPEDQINYQDETIPLLWTDNNDNENLIIKTDRQYYDAGEQTEMFFSVSNQTSSDQKTDIYFWFDGKDKQVQRVERIENGRISNFQFPMNFQCLNSQIVKISKATQLEVNSKTLLNPARPIITARL